MIAVLALLQAAASAPAANPFATGCGKKAEADVLICGSRERRSPYRLPTLSNDYEPKPIRAEAMLPGGGLARVTILSVTRPDGLQDNRVMLTVSAHP